MTPNPKAEETPKLCGHCGSPHHHTNGCPHHHPAKDEGEKFVMTDATGQKFETATEETTTKPTAPADEGESRHTNCNASCLQCGPLCSRLKATLNGLQRDHGEELAERDKQIDWWQQKHDEVKASRLTHAQAQQKAEAKLKSAEEELSKKRTQCERLVMASKGTLCPMVAQADYTCPAEAVVREQICSECKPPRELPKNEDYCKEVKCKWLVVLSAHDKGKDA